MANGQRKNVIMEYIRFISVSNLKESQRKPMKIRRAKICEIYSIETFLYVVDIRNVSF